MSLYEKHSASRGKTRIAQIVGCMSFSTNFTQLEMCFFLDIYDYFIANFLYHSSAILYILKNNVVSIFFKYYLSIISKL